MNPYLPETNLRFTDSEKEAYVNRYTAMKPLFCATIGLLFVLTGMALPAQEKADQDIPAHNPDWTDHNAGDPGVTATTQPSRLTVKPAAETVDSVAEDLQKIVVLCAQDEKQKEFEQAWGSYAEKHKLKGKELNQTIRKVISGAVERRNQDPALAIAKEDEQAWRKSRRQLMRQAVEAINKRSQEM